MQNQINYNSYVQGNYHPQRHIPTNRKPDARQSYQDVHNSYINQRAYDSTATNSTSSQKATVQLDSTALVSASVRLPGGGWMNASVFKSENYSEDNPVFLVRGTDTDGKPFEAEININNVNPRNASFVELFALDGYYVANGGQELGARRAVANAMTAAEVMGRLGKAEFDAFSKFDFLLPLQEMMEMQRVNGNLNGYTQYKHIVDSLKFETTFAELGYQKNLEGMVAHSAQPPQVEIRSNSDIRDVLFFPAYNANDPNGYAKAETALRAGLLEQMKFINCNIHEIDIKLRRLAETAGSAIHTGMSDAEKYTAIYDRYAEAFGPDFMKIQTVALSGYTFPDPKTIVQQFENELKAAIGDTDRITAARKDALYGDMSDSEVRAAIAEKYPPINRITLREFRLMVWEMNSVGADGGLSRVLGNACYLNGYLNNHEHTLALEALMDKLLDLQWLCDAYNSMRNAMAKTFANDVGSSAMVLSELFGASFALNGSGNAAVNRPSAVNYM